MPLLFQCRIRRRRVDNGRFGRAADLRFGLTVSRSPQCRTLSGKGKNEIETFFKLAADNSAKVLMAFLVAWKQSVRVLAFCCKDHRLRAIS